jgi:predicted DNA binding protein
MCTIVGATLPTEEFALKDTFAEYPRATFEAVQASAHDTDRPMSLLWAMGPDLEAIDSALRADGTTEDVRVFTRADGRRLYWIDWEPRIYSLLRTLVESGGTVLEAGATDSRWTFELLFPDHDAASRTYDRWQDEGVDLVVREVRNDAGPVAGAESPLSEEQHEALVAAFRTDYYSVPRGMTQAELAEKLDLSHQALSERLRRGHREIISHTFRNSTIQGVL